MPQRAARDAEFAAFLAADAEPLTRAAWQLGSGDRDEAAELLQSALVKTYLAWPRVGRDGALAHTRRVMGAPGAGDEPDPDAGPADVPLDVDHVIAEGRNAVRGRRMGWTVAGLAALAVVASIATPVLIAATVPPVATPSAVPTTAATPTPSPTATPLPDLVGTPWQVAGFDGVDFGPSRTMTIRFDGGVASGFSGCNTFRGEYSLDGDQLRIKNVATSAKRCSAEAGREETAFLKALSRVRAHQAALNGPVLVGGDGSPQVALVPLTADAVTWHLTGLGGAAQAGSGITLSVAGDRLSGNSGCGSYAGNLSRDGSAWTVSDLALTSTVRCPQSAGKRPARYLALLEQVTKAELDPFTLTLTGPKGTIEFAIHG